MNNMPKVWVVQEGRNDYAPAEMFGEVNFVTKGDLRKMEGQQNTEVAADVRRFLSHYVAGVDYIVPAGNPMIVALVSMALAPTDHLFLKWDGMRAMYIPYTLNAKMVK